MAILQTKNTIKFDAENAEHRNAYTQFLMKGRWGIRFELEYPFTALPAMVMFKLAAFACKDAETKIDEKKLFENS